MKEEIVGDTNRKGVPTAISISKVTLSGTAASAARSSQHKSVCQSISFSTKVGQDDVDSVRFSLFSAAEVVVANLRSRSGDQGPLRRGYDDIFWIVRRGSVIVS